MLHIRQHRRVFAAIAIIMAITLPCVATAQDYKDEAFGFRAPKPGGYGSVNVDPFLYRGNPVHFNSFLIWPNLTLQQEYNDNVFATDTAEQDDFATVLKPAVIIKKEFNRHEVLLALETEIRRYWDFSSENVENYSASLEADFEAAHTTNIPFRLSFRDGHIKRNSQRYLSPNNVSVTPLRVRSYEAESGVIYKPNRLKLELTGNYRQGELENNSLPTGQVLIRDNRDVDVITGTGRISYEMPANFEPYLELSYGDENYTNQLPSAITRDNNIIRILLGSFFDYKGLIYGFIGAGWEERSYDSNRIQNANGLTLDSKLVWEPQAKTRISFDLTRNRFEDNEVIAGITETAGGIELQHELRRDLFIKLMGSYEAEDFNGSSREDNTLRTGIGFNYISGPHLQVGADYHLAIRDSTVTGLDMENNIFMIRAKAAW